MQYPTLPDPPTAYALDRIDRGQDDWLRGLYADGCSLAASCFSCPLPVCRYDLPAGRAGVIRDTEMLRDMLDDGGTLTAAAQTMGVSRRTAYRRLKALASHG